MTRIKRDSVEYFPHYVSSGKTMFVLEQRYGNDGYAFWFKLLELLASSDGHVYYCNNESDWLFLQAKSHLSEETTLNILDTLSGLDAIDKELWGNKIIWCQNLVDNLSPVYSNRRRESPQRPITPCRNDSTSELLHVKIQLDNVDIPQSKGSRVKPTIVEIQEYCSERMNQVDAEKFFDYYESNGWMVGKNKMKDWKASVRTWERNTTGNAPRKQSEAERIMGL